jgi:hypothetical protein
MTRGRKLLATMVLGAAMTLFGVGRPCAQEPPPDPQMLLNLDLFTAHPGAGSENPPPGGESSMFDQIRALMAMGYLGAPAQAAALPQPNSPGRVAAPLPDYQYEAPQE